MNIILIGSPGAGKGTQASCLEERTGMKHIASDDMFRTALVNRPIGSSHSHGNSNTTTAAPITRNASKNTARGSGEIRNAWASRKVSATVFPEPVGPVTRKWPMSR